MVRAILPDASVIETGAIEPGASATVIAAICKIESATPTGVAAATSIVETATGMAATLRVATAAIVTAISIVEIATLIVEIGIVAANDVSLAATAAGSLALGGGYLLLRSPEATHVSPLGQPLPVLTAPRDLAPPAPTPPPEVSVIPPASAPREAAASRRLASLPRADLLRAESALLTEARAELRSGNPGRAQAALDRLQAQFPKGMLTQEREVLAIEVQHARGNVDAAKHRARAFVKAYPNSPHSPKLSRFLQ